MAGARSENPITSDCSLAWASRVPEQTQSSYVSVLVFKDEESRPKRDIVIANVLTTDTPASMSQLDILQEVDIRSVDVTIKIPNWERINLLNICKF